MNIIHTIQIYVFYTLEQSAALCTQYSYGRGVNVKPFTFKIRRRNSFCYRAHPRNTRNEKRNGEKPDTIAALYDSEPFTDIRFFSRSNFSRWHTRSHFDLKCIYNQNIIITIIESKICDCDILNGSDENGKTVVSD